MLIIKLCCSNKSYFLILQVFIPNKVYNGQKLMKEVSKKTIPTINKRIPKVPVTVFVKYNAPKSTAIKILMMRSALPMFFFIMTGFCFGKIFIQVSIK